MAGCGKVYNGQHKVEGLPLRCGVNLYWRLPGTKLSDKARRQCETVLCLECRGTEKNTNVGVNEGDYNEKTSAV